MDTVLVECWVPGPPKPKGSMQPFVPTYKKGPKAGQPVRREGGSIMVNMTDDNPGTKAWMKTVRDYVFESWSYPVASADAPIAVELDFYLRRPDNQYGTGKQARFVKPIAPATPIIERSGDLDKLVRCVLDALIGVVFVTDAAVVRLVAAKHYAVPTEASDGQGCRLVVRRIAESCANDLPLEQRVRYVSHDAARDPDRAPDGTLSLLDVA